MPEITLEQLEKIERLALAATPGKRKFYSDGIWWIEGDKEDFSLVWLGENSEGHHLVGICTDGTGLLTVDAETVLALCKALREARRALDGYEALKAHHREHHEKEVSLNARTKMLESALIWIDRNEQTRLRNGGDAEWFKEIAPMKARAALDAAPESALPRTCPRCGWGALDEDDTCVECGFVFDMDEVWEEDEEE